MNAIAVTCGDINGIGVEIALKSFSILNEKDFDASIVFIVPENVLNLAVEKFNIKNIPNFVEFDFLNDAEITPGKPEKKSGEISFRALTRAYELIKKRNANALVTAPISKEAFALAGINYKGHTDLLADWTNAKNYLMTFISPKFKTALATIHVPLKNVPELISEEKIYSRIKLLRATAVNDFGIAKPRIAVLGLNPHAGENGNIGSEEIKIINPALQRLRSENIDVAGAFVPDAFFANKKYLDFDFVFGMYHDQVLIPFKMLNFNSGVNFTAGLPFVRTSPDHGTAYEIAWKGNADPESMLQAILLADKLSATRNERNQTV